MGRIAQVVAVNTRTDDDGTELVDVVVDPGGGANVTAHHFSDSGVDAPPLPGDFAALEPSSGTGNEQISGYADVKNAPQAANGERRTYARAPDGTITAEIWSKANGDIKITSLLPGGVIDLNGVKIDQQGNITTPGDVTAKDATPATAVTLSGHVHPTGMGPSGPPTGGT